MLRRVHLLVLIGTVLVASAVRAQPPPAPHDWCSTLYDAIFGGDSEWVWAHRLGEFEIAALECDSAGLDVALAAAAALGSYRSFVLAAWTAAIVGGKAGRRTLTRLEALAEAWEVREFRYLPDFLHYRSLISPTDSTGVKALAGTCKCRGSGVGGDVVLRLSVIATPEATEALRDCAEAPVGDLNDRPSREAASAALARTDPPADVVWGDGGTSPRRERIAAILRSGLPNLDGERDWISLDDRLRFRLVDRTWLAVPDAHAQLFPSAFDHDANAAVLAFEAHVRGDSGAAIVAVTVGTCGYEVVLHRRGDAWQVVMVHPTWRS